MDVFTSAGEHQAAQGCAMRGDRGFNTFVEESAEFIANVEDDDGGVVDDGTVDDADNAGDKAKNRENKNKKKKKFHTFVGWRDQTPSNFSVVFLNAFVDVACGAVEWTFTAFALLLVRAPPDYSTVRPFSLRTLLPRL